MIETKPETMKTLNVSDAEVQEAERRVLMHKNEDLRNDDEMGVADMQQVDQPEIEKAKQKDYDKMRSVREWLETTFGKK